MGKRKDEESDQEEEEDESQDSADDSDASGLSDDEREDDDSDDDSDLEDEDDPEQLPNKRKSVNLRADAKPRPGVVKAAVAKAAPPAAAKPAAAGAVKPPLPRPGAGRLGAATPLARAAPRAGVGSGTAAHAKPASATAATPSNASIPRRASIGSIVGGSSTCGGGSSASASATPAVTYAPRPAVSRIRDAELDDEDEDGGGGGGGAGGSGIGGVAAKEAELQRRREANVRALMDNSLETTRQPVMSRFLRLAESDAVLRQPFISPMQGAAPVSDALRRKLVARRTFVPWGSSTPLPLPVAAAPRQPPTPPPPLLLPAPATDVPPAPPPEPELPEGIEPLVLWRPPPEAAVAPEDSTAGRKAAGIGGGCVVVDNMLTRFLRPHQREGVQFMFDCVTGQRLEGKHGCILADDMGLGKTLQGITLLWTLLGGGHPLLGGVPLARRAIIVCPTSLVSNWDNECGKWLKGRLTTLAMCESSREDVCSSIAMFLDTRNTGLHRVLIISYETFRMHADKFQVPHACDLLMCDEAHRLKNDATLTNRALDNMPCKRRVLLSGTPMQNHLDEFFAMVDFCNPGVLGSAAEFRRRYEAPILAGREPDATPEQVALGEERSAELSGLTNRFILRRTNKLLSQHLPPKVIEVVCCRLTELQRALYVHFLQSKAARRVLNAGKTTSGVLSAITSLKKLCNHPKLIYDAVHSKAAAAAAGEDGEGKIEGFEGVGVLFPPGLFDNGRVGRGGMAAGWEAVGGKMAVLARMLHVLYTETTDRIVLVSNYTSTLDLFVALCRERGYPFVRLDGTTTINKRQKLVKVFNDPAEKQFAFLLSSKAGGCGLNLIGANRLVLFDPDWNPANDAQAAARVWRDGQRKRVFVYRFLSTGSIEEKVFQRQMSKEGLKQLVGKTGKAAANVMTSEDLRELFSLNADSPSDTYECMCGTTVAAPEAAALDVTAAAVLNAAAAAAAAGGAAGCAAGGAAAAAAAGLIAVGGGGAAGVEAIDLCHDGGDDADDGGPDLGLDDCWGGGGDDLMDITAAAEDGDELEARAPAAVASKGGGRGGGGRDTGMSDVEDEDGEYLDSDDDWCSDDSDDSWGGGRGRGGRKGKRRGSGGSGCGRGGGKAAAGKQKGRGGGGKKGGSGKERGGKGGAPPPPPPVVVRRPPGPPVFKLQTGEPAEEDLANWAHHPTPDTLPDAVMRRVAAPDVSFIFSVCVAGKHIEGGDEEEARLAEGKGAAASAAGRGGAGGLGAAALAGRSNRPSRGAALPPMAQAGAPAAPAAAAAEAARPLPSAAAGTQPPGAAVTKPSSGAPTAASVPKPLPAAVAAPAAPMAAAATNAAAAAPRGVTTSSAPAGAGAGAGKPPLAKQSLPADTASKPSSAPASAAAAPASPLAAAVSAAGNPGAQASRPHAKPPQPLPASGLLATADRAAIAPLQGSAAVAAQLRTAAAAASPAAATAAPSAAMPVRLQGLAGPAATATPGAVAAAGPRPPAAAPHPVLSNGHAAVAAAAAGSAKPVVAAPAGLAAPPQAAVPTATAGGAVAAPSALGATAAAKPRPPGAAATTTATGPAPPPGHGGSKLAKPKPSSTSSTSTSTSSGAAVAAAKPAPAPGPGPAVQQPQAAAAVPAGAPPVQRAVAPLAPQQLNRQQAPPPGALAAGAVPGSGGPAPGAPPTGAPGAPHPAGAVPMIHGGATAAGVKVPAAGVPAAAVAAAAAGKAARGWEEGPGRGGGGGGGGRSSLDAPQPKRSRPPGLYLDDDFI